MSFPTKIHKKHQIPSIFALEIRFLHIFLLMKSRFTNKRCTFARIMETGTKLIEELIAAVLDDFREKGFSSVMPFSIGSVEIRMSQFADANGIELASEELYMSAKQLQHSMRASKNVKGLVVEASELISFPESRFSMDLYYDGKCFIYTDVKSKFIIHPNYKMKISRELVAKVNFITATRVNDPAEFTLPKYRKI